MTPNQNPARLPKRVKDATVPRNVVLEVVWQLHALADRHHQAAKSLERLALRLAAAEHPLPITAAFERYIKSDLPDSDALISLMERLECTQSAEWQARRSVQRRKTAQRKLQWHLDCGRDGGPIPEWAWDPILAAARERRDVLAAAVACCEQRAGGDEPAKSLGKYLKGECPISWLRDAMERLGLDVDGARVIPFVPRTRVQP